jgi:hypothetical protein
MESREPGDVRKALRRHGSWCMAAAPYLRYRCGGRCPTRTFRRHNTAPQYSPLAGLRRPGRPLVRCKNTPAPPQSFTVANQRIRGSELGHYLSCLASVHRLLPFALFYSLSAPQSFTVRLPASCGHKTSDGGANCMYGRRIHMTATACAFPTIEIVN